jgi:hypothetical protein
MRTGKLKMLLAACMSAAGAANATPLTMEYCVAPAEDGGFEYTFTLRLTDADGTWQPGQSFNWIVFGDADRASSPLADFVGIGEMPTPWGDDGVRYSTGTHNGPSLIDYGRFMNFPGWTPGEMGQSVTWRGRSSVYLTSLAWSNILGSGEQARFEPAVRVTGCGGEAAPCEVADFNRDGGVDGADLEAFYTAWMSGEAAGDVNADGGVDGGDLEHFFTYWMLGGC